MRIAFLRKNATMSASFKHTSVITVIEKNYRTHASLHNIVSLLQFFQKFISRLTVYYRKFNFSGGPRELQLQGESGINFG